MGSATGRPERAPPTPPAAPLVARQNATTAARRHGTDAALPCRAKRAQDRAFWSRLHDLEKEDRGRGTRMGHIRYIRIILKFNLLLECTRRLQLGLLARWKACIKWQPRLLAPLPAAWPVATRATAACELPHKSNGHYLAWLQQHRSVAAPWEPALIRSTRGSNAAAGEGLQACRPRVLTCICATTGSTQAAQAIELAA
jgi:hypothetical protein